MSGREQEWKRWAKERGYFGRLGGRYSLKLSLEMKQESWKVVSFRVFWKRKLKELDNASDVEWKEKGESRMM